MTIQAVDGPRLMAEAEAHFMHAHLGQTPPLIIT